MLILHDHQMKSLMLTFTFLEQNTVTFAKYNTMCLHDFTVWHVLLSQLGERKTSNMNKLKDNVAFNKLKKIRDLYIFV